MNWLDGWLNRTTMYRLLLYILLAILGAGTIFSWLGILPYGFIAIPITAGLTVLVCLITNFIFSRAYGAVANVESAYLSALILALIIGPQLTASNIWLIIWASVLAMATKFILSYRHKHLFNPAAIAVVLTALLANQAASWWVGTASLFPIVLIGGILVVRKIKRADLVWAFLITASLTIGIGSLLHQSGLVATLRTTYLYSPIVFFATVMLTEPLTTPPTRSLQIAYGIFVGLIFGPRVHLGSLYSTPELALVAGNIFAFLVSAKGRVTLTLKEIRRVATDTYDFVFKPSFPLAFQPGQYMELTLATEPSDNRGNRRFFTIASAPTEAEIRFGVKFYPQASQFKQALARLRPNQTLTATNTAGSFTLPADPSEKLVFIAGGIGVTPFRSQVKYLLDSGAKRDIVLLYSNKVASEIAYSELFGDAARIGLKTIYTLTDPTQVPTNWPGQVGMIDEKMITTQVPDYKNRRFYLSGPHAMVVAFEQLLRSLGVPRSKIKVDYFPGFV